MLPSFLNLSIEANGLSEKVVFIHQAAYCLSL